MSRLRLKTLQLPTVAALTANLANKTYLSGVTQFATAWGNNDVYASRRWLRNFAGSVAVPALFASFNPDEYFREVRGMGDAIVNRIPGFSQTLEPRYNVFG